MEALIEDENVMDKGVADTVKDHKRKHDDNEDDDDEDPPAGPNQGKKTKRRRTKKSESSKKPSFIKETLKDKALTKGSKTGKSASAKELVKEPIAEPWFNQMVSASKDPLTFNDLMATPIEFSKYVLNGLKIDNLTQDILLGHAFNLLKGTHRTIAADYFVNNDLEYLKTFDPKVTYTTSIAKTKAAQYEIKGIKDMVPTLRSTIKHVYEKDVKKRIKH
nr:hypothetical protein [Tanacetum cinerariifolium]GEZ86599.1 hypothetical protein [Tanacetum cinerariifolium]